MQLLVFILMLSVLILVHELGHFLSARLFKMRVEEFGIGLPPRAKTLFTRMGTIFSLNWLPLGGFVKLYGEDMENEEQLRSPEAFFNKPMWQRTVVFLAGVTMNFLLGVVVFGVVYSYLGIPTKTDKVMIVEVADDSPAKTAGVQIDSTVTKMSIEGEQIVFTGVDGFIKQIDVYKGREIEMVLMDKNNQEYIARLTPRESPPEGQGALGVALSSIEMKKYPLWQMPFRGIKVGLIEAWGWGKEIAGSLWTVIVNLVTGKGLPKDVSGPVGMYQVSKEVYKVGWVAVLQFMGILSINLAILNIMPFPALDGGRIAFLGIEKLIGKLRKNKVEGYVNAAGMFLLIGLMVLITVKDIIKLFVK
ncbi:MAG TPA: M50 family metallopeptidase [Candidatus Woesebacteria bacterium]|nr:M50 family metallopeptidase [Candidatus Woesebacteria bacterium]